LQNEEKEKKNIEKEEAPHKQTPHKKGEKGGEKADKI
jgi:hypothetical protein